MSVFPGPDELGRGVVTSAGRPLPPACASWPRVVIDDAVLAEPAEATEQLHMAFLRRRPVAVVLAADAAALRAPERFEGTPFEAGVGFEFTRERLQYLVWSNNYDARDGEPVWWHARRAERLGATGWEGDGADVRLPGGGAAFCDGGPRQPLSFADGAVVLHRESIEAGSLEPDRDIPVTADLAPDQLAAVNHGGGPARIIAPAGSGKTRVLTERLRHLLADRAVTPSSVTAVAFNRRAADELRERTAGLPAHIRTLNSLGLAIANGSGPFAAPGGKPRRVIDESEVRRILESLVTVRRQTNSDPWVPYLDALSAIRLGLCDPLEVEAAMPDAGGIAGVFDAYRAILSERAVLDFDEQIYAALELLLRRPELRRHDQRFTRHLLVDEFQDLTPAHLLMLRLLSAPSYDVFGVGDDDQVIYSYAGATPEYLIDYGRFFPGAAEHALEVNYRCPPAVVDGARHLLTHNRRRIEKTIRSAPGRPGGPADLRLEAMAAGGQAAAVAAEIGRLTAAGAGFGEIAVLSRVNSSLLPVQVTLREAGIPASAAVGVEILRRTGIRAALAYLRIGAAPGRIRRSDITETLRRPSRRIARNVAAMLERPPESSVAGIRRLGRALSGGDADKVDLYADDLETIAGVVRNGTTAEALRAIRTEIGLGSAMDALDSSRSEADRSTHLDDLAALEQVAALHPEPSTFEGWLVGLLDAGTPQRQKAGTAPSGGTGPAGSGEVTLSTVHRVKGREWRHVVVFGVGGESFPHRLAGDLEEERRVFHVAVTRCSESVVVMSDRDEPSPFPAELLADARAATRATGRQRPAAAGREPPVAGRGPQAAGRGPQAAGRGPQAAGRGPQAAGRGPQAQKAGRRGAADGRRARGEGGHGSPREGRRGPGADSAAMVALRAWRLETAKRDNVPAYVVFSDAHLAGIAAALPRSERALARCPGVGPVKLERYGDEILTVLEPFTGDSPATHRRQNTDLL